jgi:uncharacterized membrane protein YbhN (UPF0104 family)
VPLVACAAAVLAATALYRALGDYHYHQLTRAVSALPATSVALAVALTALAYAALAGYDALALAYVHRPLRPARVLAGSFLSYAVSQTAGFPLLTGARSGTGTGAPGG